jgi:N-acetyl-anhydromuramyl-L-alanine amidase AmpD
MAAPHRPVRFSVRAFEARMQIVDHRLVHDDGTPYPFVESPNVGGTLTPRWLVIHHTAAPNAKQAITWLTDERSKSSAHVVIDKGGAITQLVPFNREARHAGNSRWHGGTSVNRLSIAIELDNRGVLSGAPGEWHLDSQRVPDQDVYVGAHRDEQGVLRGWDTYPPEQLYAARELGAVLVHIYGLEDVFGHEDISPGREQDPGPAFPMEEFRRKLGFAYRLKWNSPYASSPTAGDGHAVEVRAPKPLFTVETDALNVRMEPGLDQPTVNGSPLPQGAVVEQLDVRGAWRRVVAREPVNGVAHVTGWVTRAALEPVSAEEPQPIPTTLEPPVPAAVADAIAPLVHDHVGEGRLTAANDRLDIVPEVRALCHVLMSETSKPPISVGLFGDWGTGKSFFMELMHDYIRTLAGKSRGAVAKGEKSAFCTDVVQIRFNAWHYMDSNLWASLAARIFDGLASHVAEVEPDKRAELAHRLAESEGVLAQMRVQRTAAEEEAIRRREEFRALNTQRRAARRRLGRSLGDAVLAGVRNAAQDPVLQDRLRSAEEAMKLPENSLTADSVEKQRDELRTLAGRVREVWKGLRSGRRLLLLACVLFPVALGAVIGMYADVITRWSGALAGLLAGLAPVAAWLAPRLAGMKRALLSLEQANQVIVRQTAFEERKLQEAVLAEQREVRRLESEARSALQAEGNARKTVEQIRTEMMELRSGRQLQRFLQERGAADDYRRQLGIVSLIRNDFEKLSQLLRGLENEGPQEGMPKVDRIILYIDDLDRCPENRVVEVLQAVHLLLAFPLFVVVVGVDSRWLLLSLEDHYAALGGRTRGRDGRSRRLSTPQNYLEKIFQIPFTLRPMRPEGFGKLLGSMVTVRPAAPATPAPTPLAAEHIQLVEAPVDDLPNLTELSPADHAALMRVDDGFDDGEQDEDGEHHGIDLMPPALELESWEATFLCALHPLIGSPRSAKRFVNVYQFIRARLGGDALARFRGDEAGGEYQVAALLLAALVGFPRESRPLFARLIPPGDASGEWWALVENQTAVTDPAAEGAEGVVRFAKAMKAVRGECTFVDSVDPFREWAPTIARFSFNTTHAGVD